jgi:hypothetical protein
VTGGGLPFQVARVARMAQQEVMSIAFQQAAKILLAYLSIWNFHRFYT